MNIYKYKLIQYFQTMNDHITLTIFLKSVSKGLQETKDSIGLSFMPFLFTIFLKFNHLKEHIKSEGSCLKKH